MAVVKKSLPLRMVSWNIHKGIGGVDRRYRPERIVDVLRGCQVDIMLLQEVDDGAPRSQHHRQVDLIGDALGLAHRTFHPNVRLRLGHYGNAILSRYPIDHHENIDLTRPFKKRRGALHARLTVERGRLRQRVWIYNVHLGLAEYERRQQLQHLLRWHDTHRVPAGTTVIIGGDFNDVWRNLGPRVLEPAGFRDAPGRPLTFPAWMPLRALDAVFVNGPVRITRCEAMTRAPARDASDHLPLVVALRLGG